MSSEVTGPLPPTVLPLFSSLLQLSSLPSLCLKVIFPHLLLTRHPRSHFWCFPTFREVLFSFWGKTMPKSIGLLQTWVFLGNFEGTVAQLERQ